MFSASFLREVGHTSMKSLYRIESCHQGHTLSARHGKRSKCAHSCVLIPVAVVVSPRVALAAGHVAHKEALRLVCTQQQNTKLSTRLEWGLAAATVGNSSHNTIINTASYSWCATAKFTWRDAPCPGASEAHTWDNTAVEVIHKVVPHACLGLAVRVQGSVLAVLPRGVHDRRWNSDLQRPPALNSLVAAAAFC